MVKKILITIVVILGLGAILWLWMWQGRPKELPPTDETLMNANGDTSDSGETADLPFDILSYQHENPAFRISYPSIYSAKEQGISDGVGTLPPLVAFFSSEEERAGTNLVESSVVVGTSNEKESVSTCTEARDDETFLGSIPIAGLPFDILTQDGAAAGNIYRTVRYRAAKDDICFEISLQMHSANVGNYPAGSVQEYDQATTLERLKTILYSFQFGS